MFSWILRNRSPGSGINAPLTFPGWWPSGPSSFASPSQWRVPRRIHTGFPTLRTFRLPDPGIPSHEVPPASNGPHPIERVTVLPRSRAFAELTLELGRRWLSGSYGDDNIASVERGDLYDVASSRGLDDLVIADVHAHMAEVDVEENEVARL